MNIVCVSDGYFEVTKSKTGSSYQITLLSQIHCEDVVSIDQPQAQNATDAHCFVTKLVTSNSSCNASEVFHTMVYFQSFLSHWAWKETLPSTLSPWKNVTLNSIYHYKVHASQWNPNTASEAEAKRKGGKTEGKISLSAIANFKDDSIDISVAILNTVQCMPL